MSTHDVPGAKVANRDVLAMGAWAEHEDGSLVFVESTEGGTVVFSIFDMREMVEYRHAMPESTFKDRFSWRPDADDDDDNVKWTWHDKEPFLWSRVMDDFPPGERHPSVTQRLTVAGRLGRSLNLRAEPIRHREPMQRGSGRTIMERVRAAIAELVE